MESIINYISRNFGLSVKVNPVTSGRISKLPLYLRHTYQYSEVILLDFRFILASPQDDSDQTPEQFSKHAENITRVLDQPVVFVLNDLNSWQRKRLLEKRIAFIQPGKQLYVPALLLDLNDVLNRNNELDVEKDKLSAPAQLAILYHLQVASLEDLPYSEIATKLNYSAMTITRIVKELDRHNLVEIKGSKEKCFRFKVGDRKQLWLDASALMESPVKQIFYADQISGESFFVTGGTALSEYTTLSDPEEKSYAIYKDYFRLMKNESSEEVSVFNKNYGLFNVEVWSYDPKIISNGKYVDRLSLFLTMRDQQDDRLKGALNEILNQIEW